MMIETQKIPYIKKYRDTNSVAENIELPRKVAQRLVKDTRFAEEWIISLLNATKTRVNVESDGRSELDEYCLALRSVDKSEVRRIHVTSCLEYAKKLFATSLNWIVAWHAFWFPQSFLDLQSNCLISHADGFCQGATPKCYDRQYCGSAQ